MGVQNLEYIELTDFTPGIWQRYNAAGPAKDGAAQVTDTWGCYGDPHGGLYPLHGRGTALGFGSYPTSITAGDYYADYSEDYSDKIHSVATFLLAPLELSPNSSVAAEEYDEAVFVTSQWYQWDAGSSGTLRRRWEVDRWMLNGADDPLQLKTLNTALTTEVVDNFVRYGFASFDATRQNNTTPTEPGYPIVMCSLAYPGELNASAFYVGVPGTPGTIEGEYTTKGVQAQFSHQGRRTMLYFAGSSNLGRLFENTSYVPTEELFYYPANNPAGTITPSGLQLVEEHPSGFGSWVSMNANELFLVKHRGGGVVVRGDLARPTVVRLPGIASSNGIACLGAATPLGYIYGTRNGVWVWSGGDTTQCLSDHLDDFFWDTGQQDRWRIGQPRGKFAFQHPFLFVSNNFVLDTRTGGWFRLDDPADGVFHNYEASIEGRVYAFVPNRAADGDFGYRYSLDTPASSFSWRSQPLARTRNRRLDFREVNLVVQGTGSVTVTLTGISGAAETVTFSGIASTSRPVALSKPISIQAHDVDVKVVSTHTDTGAAPTVYRVALGYREGVGL